MQVTTSYKNWLIVVNKVGNSTNVMAYSKSIPVQQIQANDIHEIKQQIDELTNQESMEVGL